MSYKPNGANGSQSRIPMADLGELTDAQIAVYDKIVGGKRGKLVGPLRVALHSPELADRWQALGAFVRFDTTLPEQVSELAIVTTGRHWNSQVEWAIHAGIAKDVGIADDVIESIRLAQSPEFEDPLLKCVYEFTREILTFGRVSDTVYRDLQEMMDAKALVELTAVVGYYSMVAMTLNAHDVPLPEDIESALLELPSDSAMSRPTRLPEGHIKA